MVATARWTRVTGTLLHVSRAIRGSCEFLMNRLAAAFLEFHELLAAWLHPYSTPQSDTLLTSDAIYNNFVRVDVVAKVLPRPADE